jgi:drug/metabolite transporter (DMT)-like permease
MDRKPLDSSAVWWMLLLTLTWGLQQVAIKMALPGMSPASQGAVRSLVAALLLLIWARWRSIPLWGRDGTLAPGVAAGLLFGAEFFFIYFGLNHTTASRLVVFLYLAPILTAVGLARWVPGEQLGGRQWAGVLLAFSGLVLAFLDGLRTPALHSTLMGDACGVVAAVLWAATTVLIRATGLARVPAEKTLFYQLAVSAPMLAGVSVILGEPGVIRLDATVITSLIFQSVVVAFASYLGWFWLLTRYLAGRLAVFSFLTPMFGVLLGVGLLGESLSSQFALAALAVGSGIALVNLRRRGSG